MIKSNNTSLVPYASTSTGGVAGRTQIRPNARIGRQPAPPMPKNENRKTEPRIYNPYQTGGTIMPRRGDMAKSLFTDEAIEHAAIHSPLWLIKQLPQLHPSVDMALYTAITLMCPVDGIHIIAVPKGAPATVPGGTVPTDDKDTASLNEMWDSQPSEVGGSLHGLQMILTAEAILTGMACVEGVPGAELTGVRRVWPTDSLSIAFLRDNRDADLTPYQRQRFPDKSPNAIQPNGTFGWQRLDALTFFWHSINQTVEMPEGKSMCASAVNEALCDLALMQDLRDAVHNAAWPRLLLGVDKKLLHEIAVNVYKLQNWKKAADWVDDQYEKIRAYANDIGPNENVVHDASGKVENLAGGSFDGLEGVLSFLRQRVAQSLKTLPTLLGINDGSTFNYTSVEWNIYAQGLETVRQCVAQVLVDIANLHLRLIGSTSIARAIYDPIRTNDALVEANTDGVRLANAIGKEQAGYIEHDEAAMSVVGHKAVAPAQPGIVEPIPGAPTQGGGQSTNPKADKNATTKPTNEQTTKEQRDAEKQRKDNK